MTDKVIEFRSRKPAEEIELDAKRLEEIEEELRKQEEALVAASYADMVTDLNQFILNQDVDGVIVIARDKKTGHFYHDIAFGAQGCDPASAISWVGMLETLKAEMTDIALMAPTLAPDGQVIGPDVEYVTIEEGEE